MDAGHQRQPEAPDAEQPVAEPLIVVHHVKVLGSRGQRPQHPDAERQRLGKCAAPHHGRLEYIGPVPVLTPARRAERVTVPVQVQAGDPGQLRPGVELGIGLAGENLDPVPQCVELTAQVADIDTLAAGVRLAAVGKQRDPERAVGRYHGLISRDGLVPMLAPNTVKSYGDSLASPHAVPGPARRDPAQQPRAIRPAVVFEPRAGTARPAVPGHSRRAARSGPDSSGPVAIISAAPLPWSNVHGANPALQRRIATEAPIKLPGNGDRKMGTYRELAQRIRWHARSRPTGSAIARAAAVAATISFAVAACSSAASSTSAAGTGSATPRASSAAPSASASVPPLAPPRRPAARPHQHR